MALGNCSFCGIVAGNRPAFLVLATKDVCAFLDVNPVSKYHTLVVPRQHFENLYDTPGDVLDQVMRAVKHVAALYRERLGIENVQVRNASGQAAGQDVFHLHFHLVPRWPGDDYQSWTPHPEWRSDFPVLLKKLT